MTEIQDKLSNIAYLHRRRGIILEEGQLENLESDGLDKF
jgi:hypothetical protein